MSMQLAAAEVTLKAIGFDVTEHLIDRITQKYVQLGRILGTTTTQIEQSARRSAAASRLKADYAKQASDDTVAALTIEQKAAKLLDDARERSAQSEKRRRNDLAKLPAIGSAGPAPSIAGPTSAAGSPGARTATAATGSANASGVASQGQMESQAQQVILSLMTKQQLVQKEAIRLQGLKNAGLLTEAQMQKGLANATTQIMSSRQGDDAAKIRGGMIASQLLIGFQDAITVYQGGGGIGRAVGASLNNIIQSAALAGPQGAVLATAGVIGFQAWQMISASMNQEAEKAKEHAKTLQEILSGAIAAGISGSRFSAGGGNEFLEKYRSERREAALLRQSLADLAAERAKLKAERPDLIKQANAPTYFGQRTGDAKKAIAQLNANLANDKAIQETQMETYKRFQEIDQRQKNMQPRLPGAQRDARAEGRALAVSEAWEVAGKGGQAVMDRRDQLETELKAVQGTIDGLSAQIPRAVNDSEREMLNNLIEDAKKEQTGLIDLKRELLALGSYAREDINQKAVSKNLKAEDDNRKELELQEALSGYRRDAGFLNTEEKVRAEISTTRKEYQTAASQPDFKETEQKYFQGKLAIQYGQLEKVLAEKAHPADTEKKLEQMDRGRIGQRFGDELGRVMNKDALQGLIKSTREELESADRWGSLTPQKQEEYLARIQQMQGRVDALNSQEVEDDRQKQIQRAVRGSQARTYDLAGYGRSIMEMAGSRDQKDVEKEMLREMGKSTKYLEELLAESKKPKGATAF